MMVRLVVKVYDNENPSEGHVHLWKLTHLVTEPTVGDYIEGLRVESVDPSEEEDVELVVGLGTAETQFGWSVDQLVLRGWETE